MSWDYVLTKVAEKDVSKLSVPTRTLVFGALDDLMPMMDGPHQPPPGTKQLRHMKIRTWRLRVGDWRVVLRPDHDRRLVSVLLVDHRSRVYKRLGASPR